MGCSSVVYVSEIKKEEEKQLMQRQSNDLFVIGAGCVGQGLAVSLLKNNLFNRVFLVTKTEQLHKIQKAGITLTGAVKGNFIPNERFVILDKINKNSFLQYKIAKNPIVFLTTKANDAVSSLYPFQQILSDLRSIVICLQNGLGIEQEVKKTFSSLYVKVLKGHVFGAVHKTPESLFAYKGSLVVERLNDACSERLKNIFLLQNDSVFNLEISSNILQAVYPKIAINCVCNPLTVIFNQPLGFIKTQYESLIRMICREVYEIALSQNVELPSFEGLIDIVLRAMSKFSNHYSSMYLDLQSGKASEIEYINGAILKIAQTKKISVPLNLLLTKSLKEVEVKRMNCESAKEFYQKYDSFLERVKVQLFKIVKSH